MAVTTADPKFLIVAFDGLRRDMITDEICPNINAFRNNWTDCPESASTFPSETRVQVSGFTTGNYPGGPKHGTNPAVGHGIMGNAFYDPKLGFDGPMDTSDLEKMAKATEIYGEPVQRGVSLAEALHKAGKTYVAVSSGKKGNARLLNLGAADRGQATFSIHGPDVSSPAAAHDEVAARFGPIPEAGFPSTDVVDYVTRATLEHFIPEHDPDALFLWFLEPDWTYHYRGVGSPESLAALKGVDDAFGRILDWWHAEGRADGWRIALVSDHGHVSVERHIDVRAGMKEAGFAIGDAIGPDADYAVKRGYMGTIFARDRNPNLVVRMLSWLKEQDWCGQLFAFDPAMEDEGALPAGTINLASPRMPDIYFILRSSDGVNEHGYPGLCLADNPGLPIGGGMHGGLHRIEMNNFLTLGGDGFRAGYRNPLACGVVDLSPTLLDMMNVAVPGSMSGRVLTETLVDSDDIPDQNDRIVEAGHGTWKQSVRLTSVDGARLPYPRSASRLS